MHYAHERRNKNTYKATLSQKNVHVIFCVLGAKAADIRRVR